MRNHGVCFLILAVCTAAELRLRNVEWGQSETRAFVYFPRSSKCDTLTSHFEADRLSMECAGGQLSISLWSDVQPSKSKCADASRGAVECVMHKFHEHRWDRLTVAEKDPQLPKLRVNYHQTYDAEEKAEDYTSPRDGFNFTAHGIQDVHGDTPIDAVDAAIANAAAKGAPAILQVYWPWCDAKPNPPCAKEDIQKFIDAAQAAPSSSALFSVDGNSGAGRLLARRFNATCGNECRVAVAVDDQRFLAPTKTIAKRVKHWHSPLVATIDGLDDRNAIAAKAGGSPFVVGVGVGTGDGSVAHQALRAAAVAVDSNSWVSFLRVQADTEDKDAAAIVHDKHGVVLGKVPLPAGGAQASGASLARQIETLLKPPVVTSKADAYDAEQQAASEGKPVVFYFTREKAVDVTALQPTDWDPEEDGEWSAPEVKVHDTPALLDREIAHVTEVAREQAGKVIFIATDDTYDMPEYGLSEADRPCAGLVWHAKGGGKEGKGKTRHAVRKADTADQLRAALAELQAGTLEVVYKSAGHGTKYVDGVVQNLTGKTLASDALAAGTDVLVFFYSSYGQGNSQHAAAAADVARVLKGSGLRVGKLDTAKNGYDARVFTGMAQYDDNPYFYFKTATRKKALRFRTKKPTAASLLKWMKDKSRRLRKKKTWIAVKAELNTLRAEQKAAEEKKKAEAKALAERIAKAESVDLTQDKDGGVLLQQYEAGEGELPVQGDTITAHYTGTLASDGTEFDSSRGRGTPFDFKLGTGGVIKCWDIAFAAMKKGAKAMVTCGSKYAYGDTGSPPKIPGGATLKFDVELVSFSSSGKKDEL